MKNAWFRLYAEFATDPKVQMMSEAYQRRLLMLFCLRCGNGDVTLHDDEVAFQLRISPDEWSETKAVFVSKGFIDEDGNILNWDKRQFISDTSNERVKRYRERKKQAEADGDMPDVTDCNVTVTPPDTDTDTEDLSNDKSIPAPEKSSSHRKTSPPVERPDDVQPDVWGDFLRLRKQKRAVVTQTALDGLRREAGKAGYSLNDALSECCARGWTGFKAEWVENNQKGAGNAKTGQFGRNDGFKGAGNPRGKHERARNILLGDPGVTVVEG